MSDRVPNMKRHDWQLMGPAEANGSGDLRYGACGVPSPASADEGPCPGRGKKDPAPMQAPRINLAVGDEVFWAAAGKGKVISVYEGISGELVAEVDVGSGWQWSDTDACFTRQQTGTPATLHVRAADLHKVPR